MIIQSNGKKAVHLRIQDDGLIQIRDYTLNSDNPSAAQWNFIPQYNGFATHHKKSLYPKCSLIFLAQISDYKFRPYLKYIGTSSHLISSKELHSSVSSTKEAQVTVWPIHHPLLLSGHHRSKVGGATVSVAFCCCAEVSIRQRWIGFKWSYRPFWGGVK